MHPVITAGTRRYLERRHAAATVATRITTQAKYMAKVSAMGREPNAHTNGLSKPLRRYMRKGAVLGVAVSWKADLSYS